MLDIFFKLAIFLAKKYCFIALSPYRHVKIAYVWTRPKGDKFSE